MFPQGHFLISTFASGPVPAIVFWLDASQVWMWAAGLLAACGAVLWAQAKPSAAPRRHLRGVAMASPGRATRLPANAH